MEIDARRGFTAQESASRALIDLLVVVERVKKEQSQVEKAVDNFRLLEELRNLSSVRDHLKMANLSIRIVDSGLTGNQKTLDVTPEGYMLRWEETQADHNHGRLPESTIFNEEVIREMVGASKLIINNDFVRRLARLKPEQIVQKFATAVSSPIQVK